MEKIVNDFVDSSRTMLENDHKKIDLVYDFLFLGQPTADPPVAPFVAQVQNSLSSHSSQINRIQSIASRLLWLVVGAALTGATWFIGTTIVHILSGTK